MLHGHIVEFPYFKFKRNHSAELYGFIYMKIHGKYGSASAERIGRHDCHEGNLSRTRDGISDADLADFMYDRFEGICAGSTELLTSQCEGLITSLAGGSNGDFEGMPENQEDETE